MAVPEYQRQELPPGETGLVKTPFELADRSSERRLAGTVIGIADEYWRQAIETQAGLEYSDFIGKVKVAEAQFDKYVTDNPNESIETYTQQQEKMLSDIQKAGGAAKTKSARQKIQQFYNANEKLIREQTSSSALAIVRNHQLKKFNEELQLAVNEGNTNRVNELFAASAKSLFGEELTDIKYKDASNKVLYQKAQNDVSLDPQAFLDAVKDGTAKGYETLRPDQIHALTTYANAVKQFRNNQAEELTTKQIQAIHELAIKNAPPDVVKSKIDQSDALTPMQKTEAWKVYNEALSVRAKTGQNPYETTQDWNAAMEAYWKAEGKDHIAPDRKDVGTKYSLDWYEKLKKIAEGGGTATDFEDSTAAKFLKEYLEGVFEDKALTAVLREKGYRLLQDAIQSASASGKPLTDREKKDKALEIAKNLDAEEKAGKFKKITPESMKTPTEIAEQQAREQAKYAPKQYQPTREEFRKRVAQLKAQGQERAARKYYDLWKKILWPD